MNVDVSVKPSFTTKGAKASMRSSTQSELNHVGNAQGVVRGRTRDDRSLRRALANDAEERRAEEPAACSEPHHKHPH